MFSRIYLLFIINYFFSGIDIDFYRRNVVPPSNEQKFQFRGNQLHICLKKHEEAENKVK